MQDDELQRLTDEVRIESALSTIKDVLYRTEEVSMGSISMYDLVSYLAEDLIREGGCAACIADAVERAFSETGANTEEHVQEGEAVYH